MRAPKRPLAHIALTALVVFTPLALLKLNAQGDLKGKSKVVKLIPRTLVPAGEIKFNGPDSDHDGMSDADEARYGTNPNDPADADADADGDGLSNADELARGSNLNNADSDGDGVSDGDEARLGYDPNDPSNLPPAGATLDAIEITSSSNRIVINGLLGQLAAVQLSVRGRLSDGSTADLTTAAGTRYESLDPSVADVTDTGLVAGLRLGTANIRVSSGNRAADISVFVAEFTPAPLSSLQMPGYANNVDASGDYAYVAAGAAGLVVVDARDRRSPRIVATLDTPGNAIDVRVSGGRAYIADGNAGLRIVDVSAPESPNFLGAVDTPGVAQDVAVRGQTAYVADGFAGLQVIDVSDATAPVVVGSRDTQGQGQGVDVSGDYAVIADGFAGLQVVNISDPALPLVGGVSDFQVAKDVVARGALAYVAAFGSGFIVVDLSTPATPVVVGRINPGEPGYFAPRDVELRGDFAAAAEQRFVNTTPFVRITDPTRPLYSGAIDFSPLGDYLGTGIALDDAYVYMTSEHFFVSQDFGTNGDTRLFIGQYNFTGEDDAGVAPTVALDSPRDGDSVVEGGDVQFAATASDDVRVVGVQFRVNGVLVTTDTIAPYEFNYTVPAGAPALSVTATAFDLAGRSATSAPALVNVAPTQPPTLTLVYPEVGAQLVEGQFAFLSAEADDDTRVTQVAFSVNGEPFVTLTSQPYSAYYFVPAGTNSLNVSVTATDSAGKTTTVSRDFEVIPEPAPVVTLTNPREGDQLIEGQTVLLAATATDNGSVSQLVFAVNGEAQEPLFSAPYRRSIVVPTGISSLTVEATATDDVGKTATASRTLTVIPDVGTTANGRVVDSLGQPVAGADVTLFGGGPTTQTGADGAFSLPGVPTVRGEVVVRATATLNGKPATNSSVPTAPVAGGVTNVGTIKLSNGPTAPVTLGVADYTGDFIPDLFVGYPDRQSLIYEFDGERFAASSSASLPFGAITSGAASNVFFDSESNLYTQIKGLAGRVRETSFNSNQPRPPLDITTGLGRESEETAVGFDTDSFPRRRVLAFMARGGAGGTELNVRVANTSEGGGGAGGAFTAAAQAASAVAESDEFGEPISVALDPPVRLRSLRVADVNGDSLVDLVAIRRVSGSDGRLVIFPRLSVNSFGPPVESPVEIRGGAETQGMVDFFVARRGFSDGVSIYVLSDERVRIYKGDETGAFIPGGEITLPAGQMPTGIAEANLNDDSATDLIVTTADTASPESKFMLVAFGVHGGSDEASFPTQEARPYTSPVSAGDTRIAVGEWAGDGSRVDVVVIDGDTIHLFVDVGSSNVSA